MRWPHESAISRRDDHLARTRKLSIWIASGASGATLALIIALSSALPGHTITRNAPATQPAAGTGQPGTGQPGTGSGGSGAHSTAGSGQSGTSSGGQIAPPTQAPSQPTAPPVVSSGGS